MTTAKVKAAPARAAEATKTIETVAAAGKETIDTVVKTSAEVANQGYEQAVAMTKEQVEAAVKAQTVAMQSYEDAIALAKDNVDAVVKAGTILTQGLQDLGKSVFGLAQETLEEQVSLSKALFGAKTLRELFDLQSTLVKTNFDKLVSEGTRLSDRSVKLVEEAMAPIHDQVNATVDRMVKAA
ncbi:MAG: phasin family protein [Actinomycetota bacterium]